MSLAAASHSKRSMIRHPLLTERSFKSKQPGCAEATGTVDVATIQIFATSRMCRATSSPASSSQLVVMHGRHGSANALRCRLSLAAAHARSVSAAISRFATSNSSLGSLVGVRSPSMLPCDMPMET